MFERILIPLDGSPRAEDILAQLTPILRVQDSDVLLALPAANSGEGNLKSQLIDAFLAPVV